MAVWIVLLRGVNVGGNKKLPMAEFRDLLGGLGYQDAATYIQSGNAVFKAAGTAAAIASAVEKAIEDRFGFHSDAFVMPLTRLQDALAANPFPQAAKDPKSLHLFFLELADQDLPLTEMESFLNPGQSFELSGGIFYLFSPDGLSKCPLADKLNKFIAGSMTARNLRSANKIAEMAENILH